MKAVRVVNCYGAKARMQMYTRPVAVWLAPHVTVRHCLTVVHACLGLMRNYLLLRNKELPQHLNCPSAIIAIRSPRKSASSLIINSASYSYYSTRCYKNVDSRTNPNQRSLGVLQVETSSAFVKDTNAIFKINLFCCKTSFQNSECSKIQSFLWMVPLNVPCTHYTRY